MFSQYQVSPSQGSNSLTSDSSEQENRKNEVITLMTEGKIADKSSISPEDVLIDLKSEMPQRALPSDTLI